MPDQPGNAKKKTVLMPGFPLRRAGPESACGVEEEQAFANEFAELLNDALAWPALPGASFLSRQRKTVTMSRHAGKSVVRITCGDTILAEQEGTEPFPELLAKANGNRFTRSKP